MNGADTELNARESSRGHLGSVDHLRRRRKQFRAFSTKIGELVGGSAFVAENRLRHRRRVSRRCSPGAHLSGRRTDTRAGAPFSAHPITRLKPETGHPVVASVFLDGRPAAGDRLGSFIDPRPARWSFSAPERQWPVSFCRNMELY